MRKSPGELIISCPILEYKVLWRGQEGVTVSENIITPILTEHCPASLDGRNSFWYEGCRECVQIPVVFPRRIRLGYRTYNFSVCRVFDPSITYAVLTTRKVEPSERTPHV